MHQFKMTAPIPYSNIIYIYIQYIFVKSTETSAHKWHDTDMYNLQSTDRQTDRERDGESSIHCPPNP